MKFTNLFKGCLGRKTLGLTAATAMTLSAGTASATLLTDVLVGSTFIYAGEVEISIPDYGPPVEFEGFDPFAGDFFYMVVNEDTSTVAVSDSFSPSLIV